MSTVAVESVDLRGIRQRLQSYAKDVCAESFGLQ